MAKLVYFNGRGRAEVIRLTLAAAGIPFTEEFITERAQFLKLLEEGKLLFKEVPLLEIDGRRIVETLSIVRYIGRKAGMCGKNEDEIVLIDQYIEAFRDFSTPTLPLGFLPEEGVLNNLKQKILPKYLSIFDKILAAHGKNFLVGSTVTIADIGLLEALLIYTEYLGKEILKDYPALQKFFTNITAQERISKYLKGPQRKPKNDKNYCGTVIKALDLKL